MTTVPPLHDLPARLGISPGAKIVLTADVTRIAWMHRRSGVKDVPNLLLDAFLACLCEEGTLVIPTFNHDLHDGETYDPVHTRPITGALAVAALAHPAFKRTRHPMHSFAVAGRLRDRLSALDDVSSFSEVSPFAVFREEGFSTVGLDMDLDYALSYFHHVEELEHVPYRRWRSYSIRYVQDGRATTRPFRLFAKRWGYANRLKDLAPLLLQAGAMHTMNVEGVHGLSVDLRKAHPVIQNDIRANKARSIVHFTWRNWLRDAWHAMKPGRRASRSAYRSAAEHARPH